MQGKHWLVVVALLSAVLGCRELNRDYYCPTHRDDPRCGREPDQCGEVMCAAPTPVCDTSTTTCVQCVADADCLNQRCSDQHMCIECLVDDDCESNLCLMDGTCAAPSDVTYVGGTNTTANKICSMDMPCQTLVQGVDPMVPARKYIKVTGQIVNDAVTTFDKRTAIVYGRSGAQISRSTAGEVVIIKMTSDVTLIDLEIVGNTTSTDKDCVEIADAATVTMMRVNIHNHSQAGIALASTGRLAISDSQIHDNGQDGVKATSGILELYRSSVYGNKGTAGVFTTTTGKVTIDSSVIAANTGTSGGVSITGPFLIRNSIISGNGNITTTTSAGGLTLNPVTADQAKFEFNTVSDNVSSSTTTGLSCSNVSFDVSNSILTGNTFNNNCNVLFSLITGTPSGSNKVGDPLFVSRTLTSPMFYRIGSLSAARDSADPAATLDVDIDGQARSDARKDMGADEFK